MYRRIGFLLALLYATLLALRPVQADELPKAAATGAEKQQASKFVRLVRNAEDEPTAMQTAIVTFARPDAKDYPTVDLVGAVHVGEKSYYETLNQSFTKYDVVLYELVAPAGTRVPKGRKANNAHFSGAVQNGMKNVLELEHQLELIDYTQPNMVHADMSPEDFNKSMTDRGESFLGMLFKVMGQSMAQPQAKNKNLDAQLLVALFDKNRAITLKRLMAEQFEELETSMGLFSGKDGSTIITERNKVALKQLAQELQSGKKRIAIFYGAGHMQHMEEQLVEQFKLTRTSELWLTAWNLSQPEAVAN